jgi:agmatine/peptidylarginine deiminase
MRKHPPERRACETSGLVSESAPEIPTQLSRNDRVAPGILRELFKDRPVAGIHAVDLVWGFGSLHCLTQQQPVRVFLDKLF